MWVLNNTDAHSKSCVSVRKNRTHCQRQAWQAPNHTTTLGSHDQRWCHRNRNCCRALPGTHLSLFGKCLTTAISAHG